MGGKIAKEVSCRCNIVHDNNKNHFINKIKIIVTEECLIAPFNIHKLGSIWNVLTKQLFTLIIHLCEYSHLYVIF